MACLGNRSGLAAGTIGTAECPIKNISRDTGMILSIERVLKLLSEGKSAEKIAEMSAVSIEDVYSLIAEARNMVLGQDRERARKKVIIKKQALSDFKNDIFDGAELVAVPVESSLVVYTDGASRGNPGPAGIGIVFLDSEDRQVGKVSHYIGVQTNNFAEYTAVIRAIKIALYFKTKHLKIRTDSELIVRQITGEYKVKNEGIKPLYDEVMKLKEGVMDFRIEHVTRSLNDKADYLAKKASNAAE